jgi:protein-L-isoaspartate(D-aspartate) O-methyltransferase
MLPDDHQRTNAPDLAKRRAAMVERQITSRGIRSELVLGAMASVPREKFLPDSMEEFAYEDSPLPIAEGQTISQPYIVALMTEALALDGGEKVLEIGTGSGYAAAVLSRIAKDVYTVERIGQLAERAAAVLADLGYGNVHVLHGDGTLGWVDHAPYDAIVVAAGGPDVPESLKRQLKVGGRLVIPIGKDTRPRRPKRWRARWRSRARRSIRSTAPTSARCCGASAMPASSCSVKRPTARRSSTGCATSSRAH